jgi:hypothetical protein
MRTEPAQAHPRLHDLNRWHRAIHQVTGDMALSWCKVTPDDLTRWAQMLQTVVEEMQRGRHDEHRVPNTPRG